MMAAPQQPMQDPNALAQAIFRVGESRDDKRRKEDKVNKMKLSSFTPTTGMNFIAQVRKQMMIHGVNPNDEDIKSALLAKVYSALPSDIQVACEANDMDSMIAFIELMSEKFTSEADITSLLRREIATNNPQLIWTKYQQLLKTLTPEATDAQIAVHGVRVEVKSTQILNTSVILSLNCNHRRQTK